MFFVEIHCGLKIFFNFAARKNYLSVAMHEPCGVNLKDFFILLAQLQLLNTEFSLHFSFALLFRPTF